MSIETLPERRFGRFVSDGNSEFVQRTGCTGVVSIVALNNNEDLIFVEQYRRPVDRRTIELVAGLVGDEVGTESLLEAARRELLEEAGYHARQIGPVFEGRSAGGNHSSMGNYYVAGDLEQRSRPSSCTGLARTNRGANAAACRSSIRPSRANSSAAPKVDAM